jgi:hypothetical protein
LRQQEGGKAEVAQVIRADRDLESILRPGRVAVSGSSEESFRRAEHLRISSSPANCTPALSASTSMGRPLFSSASAKLRTERRLARSQQRGSTLVSESSTPPALSAVSRSRAAAISAFSSVRHARTTEWPSNASFRAAARPIPLLLPVRSMRFFSGAAAEALSASSGAVAVKKRSSRRLGCAL